MRHITWRARRLPPPVHGSARRTTLDEIHTTGREFDLTLAAREMRTKVYGPSLQRPRLRALDRLRPHPAPIRPSRDAVRFPVLP
ncbi:MULTISPECIES: hypothetical protein [Streptomyces]|uniref:hypothetical protein n=1 Tax=Streptomyces TaxID=1883 RepID=UPI00167A3997|nr:hypothetical protein [Streptomyces galilaeus]GGW71102.1 hypothetical protein GCM10010350_64670 [Streptomyces galilaeus]